MAGPVPDGILATWTARAELLPDAQAPHLRETQTAHAPMARGHLVNAWRDAVRLPDGSTSEREYIIHPGAVMIIPLLPDGSVIVERQYRYAIGRAVIEFPAGKLDAGEGAYACARRELREETGLLAAQWARAGVIHPAIAYSTEGIDLWFARGLRQGERSLDPGETLDVLRVRAEDLIEACREGTVTDAKTAAGALWLQNVLSGRWTLDWQDAPADGTAG